MNSSVGQSGPNVVYLIISIRRYKDTWPNCCGKACDLCLHGNVRFGGILGFSVSDREISRLCVRYLFMS